MHDFEGNRLGELHQAFRETHFNVRQGDPFTLHIGQPSPELDELLKARGQDAAAFITAWNPQAQLRAQTENRERQAELTGELEHCGLVCLAGMGQHPSNNWPGEESVLVLGLRPKAAKALCVKYGQLACVTYRLGGVAQLLIV